MTNPTTRQTLVRLGLLLLSAVGALWSAVLLLSQGAEFSLFGLTVTSHQPLKPLLISSLILTAHILTGGHVPLPPARVFRPAVRTLSFVVHAWPPHWAVATGLALFVSAVGYVYGVKVAGGADSYGYVSQADLWLSGSLHVDQAFMKDAPWPKAELTFTPLGYRPSDQPGREWTIVPTYSPGLPLLLAGAKALGGQGAMYWVVPLLGAVLVLATFGIGTRVASATAGLIGAWLVATSPGVLYMVVTTMTDVPVAALWAAAFYCLLGHSRGSALGAGLLAAMAVVVRPNLVPLGAVFGLHFVAGVFTREERRHVLVRGSLYAAGLAAGVVVVALINARLYGSPLVSGYGAPSGFLSWSRVLPNLRNYTAWLIESQTPLVLIGVAAICLPLKALWPLAPRHVVGLMAASVATVWLLYLLYEVFDAWWYVRFLLASWPFLLLGTGAAAAWVMRRFGPPERALAVALVLVLGGIQVQSSANYGAFQAWEGERRYVEAGRLTRRLTERNSVILAMQHSGSVRYYGGRVSMRYDVIDAEWIDPAIEWLTAKGVHSYLLGDDWEILDVRRRFAGSRLVAALARPPVGVLTAGGQTLLYDLTVSGEPGRTRETVTDVDRSLRAAEPAPFARPVLRQ